MKVERYGYIWGNTVKDILNRYFGEGMAGIWTDETQITFKGQKYPLSFLSPFKRQLSFPDEEPFVFYVPAQRIISLQNGWPRFFTEYDDSVPFVLREFSESMRLFASFLLNDLEVNFSDQQGLNKQIKELFDKTIFHHAKIDVETSGKKRFKLDVSEQYSIPFMTWSAGQKEFMPLLLAFHYLCPKNERQLLNIRTVIIEEPEMGLHPQAIKAVIFQIMDLMARGYKVIVSTHSPILLEFAWALTNLQVNKAGYHELAGLFGLADLDEDIVNNLQQSLQSKIATYYFDRKENGVIVKDISTLDAGSSDEAIADWGGLTSFSARAVDIVSSSVPTDEN